MKMENMVWIAHRAVWASDKMHEDYHRAKVQLSDADFLLEEANNILIVEYKNAEYKKGKRSQIQNAGVQSNGR